MRTRLTLVSAAVLLAAVLAFSSGAAAQYVPTPGANDLGISENDVRDEPNHNDDNTNLEGVSSPKDDRLILEAYTENRFGNPFILFTYDEDVSNVQNTIVHGDNTNSYEHTMYPGQVSYEAWWGYWSDTGGGGDLQQSEATSGQAFVGDPNGAIDDASDDQGGECRDSSEPAWDEFVWRGENNCATAAGIPDANAPEDEMFAFVQPGTHDMHMNTLIFGCSCPEDATLRNDSDAGYQPDFIMEYPEPTPSSPAGGEVWRQANGFTRYEYDASLLITTQAITSVNPTEIDKPEEGTEFDALSGDAWDVDVYNSLNPVVEDAYRTTIWDPPQDYGDDEDEQNVLAGAHESGLKGYAKYPAHQTYQDTEDEVFDTAAQALESTEPATGFADDLVYGPYKHEPNTAEDTHPASLDAEYGSLDDYYKVNSQDYSTYQDGEHFWIDAQVGVNDFPIWIPFCCYGYGGYEHITPEIPDTSQPVESTASEDDDNTQGPGILYWHAQAGTWYDANEDTWVGDAHDGTDDEYDNGNDDDPNDYTSAEFRGTCSVDWDVKLVPTEDTDGDGTNDWGTTGVYVLGAFNDANPYSDVVMDVAGPEGTTATAPLRENNNTAGVATYVAPADEDGRLSRHRMEGPIDMSPIGCSSVEFGSGDWDSFKSVVFPVGSLDVSFDVVSTAELTAENRKSQKGTNTGDSLTGATITDVDKIVSIESTQ